MLSAGPEMLSCLCWPTGRYKATGRANTLWHFIPSSLACLPGQTGGRPDAKCILHKRQWSIGATACWMFLNQAATHGFCWQVKQKKIHFQPLSHEEVADQHLKGKILPQMLSHCYYYQPVVFNTFQELPGDEVLSFTFFGWIHVASTCLVYFSSWLPTFPRMSSIISSQQTYSESLVRLNQCLLHE